MADFGSSLPTRLPESTGTNYYVSTTGSDSTGDGSFGNPWLTIQKALDTVSLTGSIINVRAGTYVSAGNETKWTRQGSSTNPVTLQSFPGETAVMNQSRLLVYHASNQPAYLRIRNLTIQNAVSAVADNVKIEGQANNIEVVGCTISGATKQGINVQTTSPHGNNIQVWDCVIHTNGSIANQNLDHGIYFAYAGTNCVIANCIIYNNVAYNLQVYPQVSGIIITGCTIDDGQSHAYQRGGMVLGTESQGASNNTIAGSIFTNADNYGIDVYNGASGTMTGNNAYDCLAYGNVVGNYDTVGGYVTYTNCISGDPLYVDQAGRDYRLLPGSPAANLINPARAIYIPPVDIKGIPRRTLTAGAHAFPASRSLSATGVG